MSPSSPRDSNAFSPPGLIPPDSPSRDLLRCANNYQDENPSVRWRSDDLDEAILADLKQFQMPDEEVAAWFRKSLQAAFADISDLQRNQRIAQTKRRSELTDERPAPQRLPGHVDRRADESLAKVPTTDATDVRAALAVFEFSQLF